MRILKKTNDYVFWGFVVLLLIVLSCVFVNRNSELPRIGNYSLLEVEGDSMYPRIRNGDLIAINRKKKETYEVGDIVTFVAEDGSIITHQIVKVEEDRYFTKGVNNTYQDNDYIEIRHIIGEYKGFRIPLIGYVVGFANTGFGYIVMVVIPLGVIFGLVVKELLKEISKKRGEL